MLPYAVRAFHDFSSSLSHFGVHIFFPNVSVIFFFHSRFHADVSGHALEAGRYVSTCCLLGQCFKRGVHLLVPLPPT